MSLELTLILLVASAVVGGFSGWRGALMPDLRRGPRMVPWRFIMLLCAALAMLLIVHLVSLGMGDTANPYPPVA